MHVPVSGRAGHTGAKCAHKTGLDDRVASCQPACLTSVQQIVKGRSCNLPTWHVRSEQAATRLAATGNAALLHT